MAYFLLYGNEDGGHIKQLSQAELLQEIHDDYEETEDSPEFAAEIPDSNMFYWGEAMVIIKGEIVVPQARQVVTEYVIE